MHTCKVRLARIRDVLTTVLLLTLVLTCISAQARSADRFPSSAVEAASYYETNVNNWMDGPVQYIALDAEVDRWKDLDTKETRERYIAWFWSRRDNDLRQAGTPFKEAFYTRVAETNRRFSGFPKGWKSDRGRIWVTLGRPDNIAGRSAGGDDLWIWVYYTNNRERAYVNAFGEIHVAFARIRGNYDIAGSFAGPGIYPVYVMQAMDATREAAIVNPTIEFVARVSH